ncbi:MAG: hypothetical protein H6724_16040 [Sandaracinus sp.]|nr:hypothetical protein [Sandaracinus sp.]
MRWFLALLLVTACDSASLVDYDAGADAHVAECPGETPRCVFEGETGCEGPAFDASCIDGTWSCDPCVLGDPHCDDPRDTRRQSNCPR